MDRSKPVAVGDKFGRWRVLAGPFKSGYHTVWRCRCSCGLRRVLQEPKLVGGKTLQCRRCASRRAKTTHGKSGTLLYKTWVKIMKLHAGDVDPRWRDFTAFLRDVGTRPTPRHRLTRLDRGRPYEKGNMEWLPVVRRYIVEGIEYTLAELAFAYDIKPSTLGARLLKMPLERALKLRVASPKEPRRRRSRVEHPGPESAQ